jgi:hypothetical protein
VKCKPSKTPSKLLVAVVAVEAAVMRAAVVAVAMLHRMAVAVVVAVDKLRAREMDF